MNGFEQFKQTVDEAKKAIFGEIDSIIAELEESGSVEKFYEKGTRSAGSKIRKQLQNIRKAIHNPTNAKSMATIKDGARDLRDSIANS